MLACATGAANEDVAARLGVAAHRVSRWRARFVQDLLGAWRTSPAQGLPGRSPTCRSRK
ncbi:hypothetical protein ACFXDO_25350 [Streptomyces nigra]|uniref:hypothetical protein n=1 Tax=Streptomyces nigra TaxID=1827580 RepID=UPI0036C55AA1